MPQNSFFATSLPPSQRRCHLWMSLRPKLFWNKYMTSHMVKFKYQAANFVPHIIENQERSCVTWPQWFEKYDKSEIAIDETELIGDLLYSILGNKFVCLSFSQKGDLFFFLLQSVLVLMIACLCNPMCTQMAKCFEYIWNVDSKPGIL